MSRTIINISIKGKEQELLDKEIRNILIADDYREIDYNREIVWKKGTGLMTAMHYIKIEYSNDTLTVSGWVQIGLGSVGGKESSLEGFSAKIPKKSVKNTIEKIRTVVESFHQV